MATELLRKAEMKAALGAHRMEVRKESKSRLASAPSVNAGGKTARCGCFQESSPGGRFLQLQSYHTHHRSACITGEARLQPLRDQATVKAGLIQEL